MATNFIQEGRALDYTASGSDIQEISLIFGQIQAAGKLTGERLLQLQERAIPIGPAIAKTMGIAESAVKDAVTKGEVDLKTFEEAFNSLNEQGQFAFEGMEQASRTLSGRISTLKDNFALLQNDVGQQLLPAFKAITTAFTTLIQSIRESDVFKQLLVDIGNNIPNAIALAVRGIIFFNNAFQNTRIFLNDISILFDRFIGTIAEVAISVIKSGNAVREFFGQEPKTDTLEFLEAFSEVTAESAFATEQANQKIARSRDELNKFIQESGKLVIETYESEKAAVEAEADATVVANEKKMTSLQSFFTLRETLEAARAAVVQERREGEALIQEEQDNSAIQRLINAFGREEAATIAFQAQQLINQKKFEEAKVLLKKKTLEADKKLKAQEDANEKARLQNLRGTLGTIASLTSSNNKTLFRIGKAAAITQATIDGFGAVQKALNSAPPPFNFALAALVGAATAANVSKIASQQPPAFQDGGIVPGNSFSGDNVAAQVNSGEVILNREQQAQTLFAIANGAGGGGERVTNVTVELDGEVVGRAVSRQVADGLELGEIA